MYSVDPIACDFEEMSLFTTHYKESTILFYFFALYFLAPKCKDIRCYFPPIKGKDINGTFEAPRAVLDLFRATTPLYPLL